MYAPLSRDDIAGKWGREVLQCIIDGTLPQPPISPTLTFRLIEVGEGTSAFEGDTGPHLLNPLGIVHGGWALTLIDSATGCAAYSTLPADTGYTTVETKGNFTRAIQHDTGRLRCEARVVHGGRQIIVADARIVGADGKLYAHGTSTILVLAGR